MSKNVKAFEELFSKCSETELLEILEKGKAMLKGLEEVRCKINGMTLQEGATVSLNRGKLAGRDLQVMEVKRTKAVLKDLQEEKLYDVPLGMIV